MNIPCVEAARASDALYGSIIDAVKVTVDDTVETASVMYCDSGIEMRLNIEFLDSLTLHEAAGVIKHECLHVILSHLDIMDDMCRLANGNSNHAEICMEVAVNEIVGRKNLPDVGYFLDCLNPKNGYLQERQSTEYYIMNSTSEDSSPMVMSLNGVKISRIGDRSSTPKIEHKVLIQEAMGRSVGDSRLMDSLMSVAASSASSGQAGKHRKSAGGLSVDVSSMEFVLHEFASGTESRRSSRPSRRTGFFPGITRRCPSHMTAYIDVSGSMGKDKIDRCISYLELVRDTMHVDISCHTFSSRVENDEPISIDELISSNIKYGGGTSFSRVMDHSRSKGYNKICMITDGECEEPSWFHKIDLLYVIIGGKKMKAGRQINIL